MTNDLEWRVVSVNVFGTFRCFDNEEDAKRFMGILPTGKDFNGNDIYRQGSLANNPRGEYRLESRLVGGTRDDWKTVPLEVMTGA